ncbi:MAG: hypothetical protein H6993_11120 [Pseudomonadales bacterium]|nr:hypothetical protein [Pseudomonadales bacterium]MCP5184507.1 hypothetical protein [Pseudomonadales bacterium]
MSGDGQRHALCPRTEERRDDFAWGLSRFLSDARMLSRFEHPHILRVHAVFEANGTGYWVMAYEQGRSFQALLDCGERFDDRGKRRWLLLAGVGLLTVNIGATGIALWP